MEIHAFICQLWYEGWFHLYTTGLISCQLVNNAVYFAVFPLCSCVAL